MDSAAFKLVSSLDATEPATGKEVSGPVLSYPMSLVGTPQGKLYILDRNSCHILTIERGKLVKIAGGGGGMRNGPAQEALFQKPSSLCLSATNDLLIADTGNHAIRLLCAGEVTTFAGGNGAGKENGVSKIAKFSAPNAIALNPFNYDVLVCDSGNHCIRLIASANVSDFAGCGIAGKSDGPSKEAKFRSPEGLIITSTGDVLVADTQNHLIRLICDGMVTTLAGDGTPRFGDGSLEKSRFSGPTALCLSPHGDLVVVDPGNSRIRMISNGQVTTIAGNGENGYKNGTCAKAQFNLPTAAVWTRAGHLLIADGYNQRVRLLIDENHVMSPDFKLIIDLHDKPEKFSIMLGDIDIPMKSRTWHLQRCILQQRCPALVKEDVISKFSALDISLRGQRLFWLYIYADMLPEGQYGASEANIRDWIELHEMALTAQLDRLAAHAKWRASYLLTLPNGVTQDTLSIVAAHVTQSFPEFLDCFVDILATLKSNFPTGFGHFEKILSSAAYGRLQTKATLTAYPIARPTNSPYGALSLCMEGLCPTSAGSTPSAPSNLRLSTADGKIFNVHSGVLVARWPLIFTWFYTREHKETLYEFPEPGQPGGLSASALLGMLRYFYTGRLDYLKSTEDCIMIGSQAAELKLTTESCGILLAYCWDREASSSSKGDKSSKDKCNLM